MQKRRGARKQMDKSKRCSCCLKQEPSRCKHLHSTMFDGRSLEHKSTVTAAAVESLIPTKPLSGDRPHHPVRLWQRLPACARLLWLLQRMSGPAWIPLQTVPACRQGVRPVKLKSKGNCPGFAWVPASPTSPNGPWSAQHTTGVPAANHLQLWPKLGS